MRIDSVLWDWTKRAGVSLEDLREASGLGRYATVWAIAEGRHVARASTAMAIAEGSAKLVRERGLAIEPLSAAEILGVAA
jgi:hypothetical protein